MKNLKRLDNGLMNKCFVGQSDSPDAISYDVAFAYKESLELGNEFINFSDVWFAHRTSEILTELEANGIVDFTISGSSSALLGILAELEQNYWIIQGMTEVIAGYIDFETGQRAMIPALMIHYKY